jgi:hypothetical protein
MMTQSKQEKDTSPVKTDPTNKSRFGHWVRVAVMCLSGGFIYPNVMTEDDDPAKYHYDKEVKTKKE